MRGERGMELDVSEMIRCLCAKPQLGATATQDLRGRPSALAAVQRGDADLERDRESADPRRGDHLRQARRGGDTVGDDDVVGVVRIGRGPDVPGEDRGVRQEVQLEQARFTSCKTAVQRGSRDESKTLGPVDPGGGTVDSCGHPDVVARLRDRECGLGFSERVGPRSRATTPSCDG